VNKSVSGIGSVNQKEE